MGRSFDLPGETCDVLLTVAQKVVRLLVQSARGGVSKCACKIDELGRFGEARPACGAGLDVQRVHLAQLAEESQASGGTA